MLSEDRIREINELFYNSLKSKDLSNQDMTTLKAMQKELDLMIREKEEQDFKARVTMLQGMIAKFKEDYPFAEIRVDVEIDDVSEEVDILNLFKDWVWTK